jgi:hypothetical protein
VFQNEVAPAKVVRQAKSAVDGAGISLPSLPSFSAPSLPSFGAPSLPSFKAPSLGLTLGTLAIPGASARTPPPSGLEHARSCQVMQAAVPPAAGGLHDLALRIDMYYLADVQVTEVMLRGCRGRAAAVVTIGGGFVLLSKLDVGFGAFMRESVVKARARAVVLMPRLRGCAAAPRLFLCSARSAVRRGFERVVLCQSPARTA